MTTTTTASTRSLRIAGVLLTPATARRYMSDPENYAAAYTSEIGYDDVARMAAGVLARRRGRNCWGEARSDAWSKDQDGRTASVTYWFYTYGDADNGMTAQYEEGYDSVIRDEVEVVQGWINSAA